MRKTTITVAAFMAVAAASYAAVTPPNAGYEFTIAKGKNEASQTFSLKEGTYSISIKEFKGSIKVDDKDYLAGNILTVEAAKDVKITVILDADADEEEKVTLTIVPTTKEWTTWLADQQTIITNLMSEASNLGKGAGTAPYMKPEDKSIEAGWRTDLISRISDIQKAKNACGIVEYNEWLANGKTSVNSLSGLDQLKKDVNDKTANHNAYQYAINTFKENKEKGGDLDYSELTKEYTGSAANGLFIDTYETLIKEIDGVEANAWDVYIAGNAAANYEAQKLATLISDLKGRIDKLTEAIANGSDQYANWIAVDGAVNSAIAFYNTQFNNLYSQLAASTLQEGYGKDIYNDYYEDAVKELNAILAKIYAVKNANDAAKEAYDKDKKHNINGLGYYELNAGWEVKNIKQSLADVYSKYVTTGADGVVPANTLRGAYKDHIAIIESLLNSLYDFNKAKDDTDKDVAGTVIGTYFTGKVNALATAITNLKNKVKAANKDHTIADKEKFDIEKEGKSTIDTNKASLDIQNAAYGKYAATRGIIDDLETETFAKAKEDVGKLNYEEFNANDRFSNAHIVTAISDFRTAAREKYTVGAKDYNYVDCETKNNEIERQINTWQTDATNAFDKYKAINDAIDAYELEINGRAEDAATGVTEIKSWASVVLNENVTVGGDPRSKTYRAIKDAADYVKATAKGLLDTAMAVDSAKVADFKTALTAAYNEKSKVDAKTTEIRTLKGQYKFDAPVWQNMTSYQAAKDAKDESLSLLNACQTAASAIPSFGEAYYGKAAAATLTTEKNRITGLLGGIQEDINDVAEDIPESYNPDFDQDVAATAIAQINEIKEKLATVDAAINKLVNTTAPVANRNFTVVKTKIGDIWYNINGRDASQGVTEIKSIEALLAPETNATITAAITTLNGKVQQLWEDLDAASDVADARKDKPKDGETPAVVGLDTRCENLLKKVNDYRTKAENESKNKKNLIAWNAFLDNPYNTTPATSAKDIIDANKKAIDNALENSTSDGEKYFQGLIGDDTKGKQKEFKDIKDTVDDLYDNKLAAPNDAFTDPANNLTDAKLEENKNKVLAILKAVKTYPGLAKANEEAYDAQDSAYTEVLGEYEKLRLEISSAKPSGDKFTASYNKALEELTAINDSLVNYNKNKVIKYAEGASDAFDAKATLSVINGINDKITTLSQTWKADESTEGSYLKAVADDNAARYNAFLSALDELKVAYYGKTVGTIHTDGAIDIVSKLSSLSYADKVDLTKYPEYPDLVDGDDGLYKYADKIADLASKASENKEATKAPAFWDFNRTFAERANEMKTAVETKQNKYAELVNAEADSTYKTWIGDVEGKLKKARTALTDTKLAANDTQADNLLRAVTSPSLGKSVVDIHDEAIQAYNSGTPVADFAYKLDKEFLPVSAEVQHLIDTAMDKAAGEAWEALCAKVDTITDEAAMAKFMWNEDYATVKDMSSFVKGAAPTDFKFSTIVYDKKFAGYEAAKRKYKSAVQTRTINSKEETHTKEYWSAYESNEEYNKLKEANTALQNAISTLTKNLNDAEAAIKSLLVEHDENLAYLITSYRKAINGLTYASDAEDIQKFKIDILNSSAIRKEMQAVNIELTNMRSYIELNVEEAKRAKLITKANDLQKKNEDTYNDFTNIQKNVTAAQTYAKYQAIEKEIGAFKTTFDTTVKDAATEVAGAIAGLESKYSEFETLYNATFPQTQDQYKVDKASVEAQIAELKAKVAAQGDAISIEKANNLKAVEKAEDAIKTLSAYVTAYNKDYVENDNFVKEQLDSIAGYEKDLADVVAKGLALKNNDERFINEKRDEILRAINGCDNSDNTQVKGAKELLKALINSVKTSSYATERDAVETAIKNINAAITKLEKDVLKYDLTQESTNVKDAISALEKEIDARIPEGASLRATLTKEVDEQKLEKGKVDSHKNEVVKENWHNVNEQWVQWSVVEEHAGVMSSYNSILTALSEIEDRIVTPGAIGDKETVTSDDIESMIQFILNPSEAAEKMDVADIDEDGKVTVADLTKVKNYYLYHNYAGYTPSSSAVRAYPTAVVAGSLDMAVNGSFLNVSLDTQVGYAAIQLDVTLPAGVVLTDAAFAGATEGVQAMYNKIGENTWRVLLFSEDNSNLVDGTDLLSLGLAGKGYGNVNIGNAMGSNTRGILIPIPGDSDDIDISTGIEAPAEIAGGNSFFYGINAAMQRSFEKGVNIVKEAGKKAIKVLQRK